MSWSKTATMYMCLCSAYMNPALWFVHQVNTQFYWKRISTGKGTKINFVIYFHSFSRSDAIFRESMRVAHTSMCIANETERDREIVAFYLLFMAVFFLSISILCTHFRCHWMRLFSVQRNSDLVCKSSVVLLTVTMMLFFFSFVWSMAEMFEANNNV